MKTLAVFRNGLPDRDDTSPMTFKMEMILKAFWNAVTCLLVDNKDDTVTDKTTGLMWQADDDGNERNWKEAAEYAKSLRLAGHSDWRLPSKKELLSLHKQLSGVFKGGRRKTYFPGMKYKSYYWTCTPYHPDLDAIDRLQNENPHENWFVPKDAAIVSSCWSGDSAHASTSEANYVRCVRLGRHPPKAVLEPTATAP